jgi:rhodanese-related sulfurtransferase
MRKLHVIAILWAWVFVATVCLAEDFPYRKDFPDIPVIELSDLKAGYDDGSIIMLDVRSDIEYETIHAKKAKHISLATQNFMPDLKALEAANPGKKIAAYCNGITCLKSYHAAQKAKQAGLTNVYAFDAGIPAFAKAYPADTILLGKELVDPEKQLISKSEFQKSCVDFETFKKAATEPNAVVIDTRDPLQRTEMLPGFEKALPIPLDKLIGNVISKGNMKDKKLLVFDQVGKQVDWLQYYLKEYGYTDYLFLDGGATSVLKEQKFR